MSKPAALPTRIWRRFKHGEDYDIIAKLIFDTMMVYKERDRIDDLDSEWDHIFSRRSLDRILKHSPRANGRLTKSLADLEIQGKTLRLWSEGEKRMGVNSSDFLLNQAFHPLVMLARSFDQLIRHEDNSGDILPSTTRGKHLEIAICRVLDDDLLLMDAESPDFVDFTSTKKWHQQWRLNLFVGWAHPNAQIGDELCLLEGCTLPVILRRKDDENFQDKPIYTIIGDAHVTSMMNGELWLPTPSLVTEKTQEVWLA